MSHRIMMILALGGLMLAGCNNEPFDYVKVKGKVTYEDGSVIPADSIELWFASTAPPVDENTHPRPAKAGVNIADGTFGKITSHKPGDGVVKGEHKVAIFAYKNGQISNLIPKEYTNARTTPLLVDTKDAPWEIKVKKKL